MLDFTDPIEKLIEENSSIPFIFFDFDGVINMDSHGTGLFKHRRESVYVEENAPGGWGPHNGNWYLIQWSEKLIDQLLQIKESTPYRWVWLTTWTEHISKLDLLLEVKSDATAYWDSASSTLNGEALDLLRSQQKLKFVTRWRSQNPNVPMVWIDDEATKLWTGEDSNSLILTPNPDKGLQSKDADRIRSFLQQHFAV